MNSLEKRVSIICPVTNSNSEEEQRILRYMDFLQTNNYRVHYPKMHTPQNYRFGYQICTTNKEAIKNSDEVHIYYSPTSTGSIFDVGMAFMAEKTVKVINIDVVINQHETNDMASFLLRYADNLLKHSDRSDINFDFYKKMLDEKNKIKELEIVPYKWEGRTQESLFRFGMIFMAEKPIQLINKEEVKMTPKKSFENILLVLHGKAMREKQIGV